MLLREGRELGRHARRQLRRRECRHRGVGEDITDDRGRLENGALAACKRVEAGSEERLDRRGDVELRQRASGAPRAVRALENALVDEHSHELLREERIPLCRAHDAVEDLRVERPAAEQALDHRSAGPGVERLQLDPRRPRAGAPGRIVVHERRPRRAEDQHGCVVEHLDELLDHLAKRLLRPVDVLDDERHGTVCRDVAQEVAHPPGELFHGERLGAQADHRGEPLSDIDSRRVGEVRELLECLVGAVVVDDPCRVLECLGERPERDAVPVREAPAREEKRPL